MNDFIKTLSAFSPIDNKAADDLQSEMVIKIFEKGSLLIESGKTCRQLYFLQSGLVKLFFQTDEKDFIMRFFPEKSIFTALDSYINQTKSEYSIIALETTTVCCVSHSAMELLCKKHHCIETAFRKFVSVAAVNMMGRISEMLEENATNRYNNFVRTNNQLLHRISLGDLASYLGITQVSLSRIRAKR